jgi:hypothetical protein
MCHSKPLNQFMRNNLKILDSKTLEKLKEENWRNAPTLILKCVKCGKSGRITMPIVQFCNYDGTKIKCYQCQGKSYGNKRL